MTFIPFPRPVREDPNLSAEEKEKEAIGGMMAAHAILQTIRGPLDLARFYREHGGPSAFARKAFPPARFSMEARQGFIAFFLEIESKMKREAGPWSAQ